MNNNNSSLNIDHFNPHPFANYAYFEMYMAYKDAGRSFMLCFMAIILNIIVIPGIFMNISIIYITIKYKNLRGTSSFLLALTALYEVIHEFAHQVFLVVALSGHNFISYWTVFCLEAIPLWGCSSSVVTITFTGLDRLLQIGWPKWHENVNRFAYLGSMVISSLLCGSLIALKFWDIAVHFPDFPQTGTLSDVFLFDFKPLFFVYMGICNTLSIAFYIAVGISVRKQTAANIAVSKDSKNNVRLFKSLVVIVSVTIGAYLATAMVRLVILPPFHLDQILVWIIELAFGTLLNLGVALNAPVLYICSHEYRKCYNREFKLIGTFFGGIRPSTIYSISRYSSEGVDGNGMTRRSRRTTHRSEIERKSQNGKERNKINNKVAPIPEEK